MWASQGFWQGATFTPQAKSVCLAGECPSQVDWRAILVLFAIINTCSFKGADLSACHCAGQRSTTRPCSSTWLISASDGATKRWPTCP
jgi:hypothetical protein